MRHAVLWTAFFISLILLEMGRAKNCHEPYYSQCENGCYYNIGNCEECTNCTRNQLVDIISYHKKECTSFPALCKMQGRYVDWRDYATDFHPINLPPLMGSFVNEDMTWLLSFFQEGNNPTVGKLCLMESQKIPNEWFTFQKALLNCTGQGGVTYNRLLAVKNHTYNTSLFFALLSALGDEKNKSALCVFISDEMKQVFRSGIFYDPTVKGEWTAFPMEDIPQGSVRIGECNTGLIDPQKNFIRTHAMMFDNVTASQALEGDGVFTALESIEKKGRDEQMHIIIFIGTDDGRILKYASPNSDPIFVEEIYSTKDDSVGITGLEIVWETLELKIQTTDAEEPLYEPLQRCSNMETQCVCEQDPYCAWNVDDSSCRSFDWRRDSDPQPPITKKTCKGIPPGSALLITNKHNRPIKSHTAGSEDSVTTEREDVVYLGPPNSPGSVVDDPTADTFSWQWAILVLCLFFITICFGIALWTCHMVYWKKSTTYPDSASNPKAWSSDWTSITFDQKRPCLNLRDTSDGGREYTGEIFKGKTVFKGLRPLTDYEVSGAGERSPFIVSTKGPVFSNWVETCDTVEVTVSGWSDSSTPYLVLKYNGQILQRKDMIAGLSVTFSGLKPNMKCSVWLEVTEDKAGGVIEKYIQDVKTKGELFCIAEVDGKPCLKWSGLLTGIERYIHSCTCGNFENFLTDIHNLQSGWKELPPLPLSANFCFDVMTIVHSLDEGIVEHTIASVFHTSPDIGFVKLSEESSTVELPPERSGLAMTRKQGSLCSDDSSSRVCSLPESEHLTVGSCDDSSGRIRSEPTVGTELSDLEKPLLSRQMSFGTERPVIINSQHSHVFVGCNVSGISRSSSSGVSSTPSSEFSFSDLPLKGFVVQISEEYCLCPAGLNSLITLPSEKKHDLSFKIYLSKQTLKCICEILNYSSDEVAYFVERTQHPNDALQPIIEKELQSQQISVAMLLYKLMKVFASLSKFDQAIPIASERENLKDMCHLYNVVDFMATTVHSGCRACNPILHSVRHVWICRGFEKRCSEVNPHLFGENAC